MGECQSRLQLAVFVLKRLLVGGTWPQANKELTSPLGQGLHGNAASAWHKVNLVVQNWLDEAGGVEPVWIAKVY